DRALREAGTSPPRTLAMLHGILATVTIPIFWITRRMADAGERRAVKAMYRELQSIGRVEATLPDECRQIRDALAGDEPVELESIATPPVRPAPPARKAPPTRKAPPVESANGNDSGPIIHSATPADSTPSPDSAEASRRRLPEREHVALQEEPATPSDVQSASEPASRSDAAGPTPAAESESLRFWLSPEDPLVDAPSIGSKTARRLRRVRMRTVADLLECDPYDVSDVLDVHYMDGETIRSWQEQASLMCRVPGLRGHDAQILVACGITEPEDLAVADVDELTEQCRQFVESDEGQRLLRDPLPPTPDEVAAWIDQAEHARPLAAA
ncbi:MAG: DUF4332 domain-containing protein, partial [Maioricimonas sp. JB049]